MSRQRATTDRSARSLFKPSEPDISGVLRRSAARASDCCPAPAWPPRPRRARLPASSPVRSMQPSPVSRGSPGSTGSLRPRGRRLLRSRSVSSPRSAWSTTRQSIPRSCRRSAAGAAHVGGDAVLASNSMSGRGVRSVAMMFAILATDLSSARFRMFDSCFCRSTLLAREFSAPWLARGALIDDDFEESAARRDFARTENASATTRR
jgi:hypothetical protein